MEYKRYCHVNRNCIPFPFDVGSMFLMIRFQLILHCASSPDSSLSLFDQIPFSVCNIFDDVDDSYWAFNKLLREIVDEHVPIKRRRTRKHEAPFLNTEYRKMLRKKATDIWKIKEQKQEAELRRQE